MDTEVAPQNSASESVQEASDATASPSSAANPDATAAESSTPTGADKPKSLSEALDKVPLEEPQEGGEAEKPAEDEQPEASPTPENAEAGEEAANGAAGSKDGQPKADATSDGSLNVPFEKTPEWQAMAKLVPKEAHPAMVKAMRPVFEKSARLQHQLKQEQPLANVAREFRHYAGDEAGFQTMRNIVRAYATDPAASVPVLENMLADARQRAGLEVTSPDLKARLAEIDQQVADGLLDETVAAKWKADISGTEQVRAKTKQVQEQQAQQRQAEARGQIRSAENALNAWEENIRERDPDFGDVTDADDPNHGKSVADQVFDGLCLFQQRKPEANQEQIMAEVARIYSLAKSRLANRGGPMRKVITSHSSSVTAKPKPTSVRAAMDAVKLEG